jgi:predicted helicase
MHEIFDIPYANWASLESALESIVDNKEKGDAFEEFVYFYFDYNKAFYQIEEVYAQVIPGKHLPKRVLELLKLEAYDHGVDGVALLNTGQLLAYQAKFRNARVSPTATELATFWAEAERADLRCIISNSFSVPPYSLKMKNHLAVLGDKFSNLDTEFFLALQRYATAAIEPSARTKHSPRRYQQEILDNILTGFDEADRGKLIAACGIGKTLIALWASEALETQIILFLAPSLALIRQTLKEWTEQAARPFSYLCVCSDKTVDSDIQNDEPVVFASDMDVPVSTNAQEVTQFLTKRVAGKRIVFSTYHSLDVIVDATRDLELSFDLMILDEAHRTAGASGTGLFSLALSSDNIRSKKRLFMTATERMVKPWIKSKVEESDRVVFSMDDQAIYGPTFYRLSFGRAIEEKIISDYRIVVAGIAESELSELIRINRYLDVEEFSQVPALQNNAVSAQIIFKVVLLLRVLHDLGLQKMITFHSSVKGAKEIISVLQKSTPLIREMGQEIWLGHVNGSISAAIRASIIGEFERAAIGVLSNVRCLSEGVDIPLIDSVFFADPKDSPIDIVQAVGRALRQPYGQPGKVAYIILPVVLSGGGEDGLAVNEEVFESLYSVIQALRDQDETLAEWIDQINLTAVKGRTARSRFNSGKLQIFLPQGIDLDTFYQNVILRIAEVNRNPSGTTGLGSKLGKKERISSYVRSFRTFGDYNVERYRLSCAEPTIALFEDIMAEKTRAQLRVDNNNVSHTERLGLIAQSQKNLFRLTSLGALYFADRSSSVFKSIFKNQMLLYEVSVQDTSLFPYRVAFQVLKATGSLNYVEFIYGLYSIPAVEDMSASIEEVCDRVFWIRQEFPNVQLVSEANQPAVLAALNGNHPIGFKETNVWTDRTTIANQYRYFVNHMSLFEEVFSVQGRGYSATLNLTNEAEITIEQLLDASRPADLAFKEAYGEFYWFANLYQEVNG